MFYMDGLLRPPHAQGGTLSMPDLVWSLKLVLGWGTAWEYQVQYRVTVSNETQQVIYQSEDWLFEPWLLQPACQCTRVQDTEPTITLSCLLECDCVNFKQKALRCRNKCLCVWEHLEWDIYKIFFHVLWLFCFLIIQIIFNKYSTGCF